MNNAKALRKALKARVKYDDGTVVRFVLVGCNARGVETRYRYAAIWIEMRRAWFLTGAGWQGDTNFTDERFLNLLSEAEEVEVATGFESV